MDKIPHATYVFAFGSEIKVADGDWPPLLFERRGKGISIVKPLPRTSFDWQWDSMTLHSKTPPPPEWYAFESGRGDPETTLVTIGVTPPPGVSDTDLYKETRDTALSILQEFASWVRVLTRQYWVGRRGRASKVDKYLMYIGELGSGKPRHTGAAGWGFEYGRDLDEIEWAQIGDKLASGQRPCASSLFFCDALLDVAEGNVAQAVAGLGVSCEVEIRSLMRNVIRRRREGPQRHYDKFMRLRFREAFCALVELGCRGFEEFDQEAHRLVIELYRARGTAVHQGDPALRGKNGNLTIRRTDLPKYVSSVEKLFAWSDAEGSRLRRGSHGP